jgi:hypothetical protein
VIEFARWFQMVLQYSTRHSVSQKVAEGAFGALNRALNETSPLTLGVLKDNVLLAGQNVDNGSVSSRLAPLLHERGVVVIRFHRGVSAEHLVNFAEMLTMPVGELYERGGVGKLLLERSISRIEVEELAFALSSEEREELRQRQQVQGVLRAIVESKLDVSETATLLRGELERAKEQERLRLLLEHQDAAVSILQEQGQKAGDAIAAFAAVAQGQDEEQAESNREKLLQVFSSLSASSQSACISRFDEIPESLQASLRWLLDGANEQALARIAVGWLRNEGGKQPEAWRYLTILSEDPERLTKVFDWMSAVVHDVPSSDLEMDGWVSVVAQSRATGVLAEPWDRFTSTARRLLGRYHGIQAALTPVPSTQATTEEQDGTPLGGAWHDAQGASATGARRSPMATGAHAALAAASPIQGGSGPEKSGAYGVAGVTSGHRAVSSTTGANTGAVPYAGGTAKSLTKDPRLQPYDARRIVGEVVAMSAKTRRFAMLCSMMPESAERQVARGRTTEVVGMLRGLRACEQPEWRELVADTFPKVLSMDVANRILTELDERLGGEAGGDPSADVSDLEAIALAHPLAVLDRLSNSNSRKSRRFLIEALAKQGPSLRPTLRANLSSSKWFVVRNAVQLLGRVGGTSQDLATAAKHLHEKVRLEVVRTCRNLPQDEDMMTVLAPLIADGSAEVAKAARGLLSGKLLSAEAIRVLETIAADESQSVELRHEVVVQLGRCPKKDAAAALFRIMQPKGLLDMDATRELAATALYRSTAEGAKVFFQEGLQSSVWRVRKACQRAASGG